MTISNSGADKGFQLFPALIASLINTTSLKRSYNKRPIGLNADVFF